MKNQKLKYFKGFTLKELLVVIVILLILTSLTVLTFSKVQVSSKVTQD